MGECAECRMPCALRKKNLFHNNEKKVRCSVTAVAVAAALFGCTRKLYIKITTTRTPFAVRSLL